MCVKSAKQPFRKTVSKVSKTMFTYKLKHSKNQI